MKPRIDRDSFVASTKLKVGQPFELDVTFRGAPAPKPTWTKGGKVQEDSLSGDLWGQ